jgi:hypothetical protein
MPSQSRAVSARAAVPRGVQPQTFEEAVVHTIHGPLRTACLGPARPQSIVRRLKILIALTFVPLTGCITRTLTVQTSVPGALVYLNDREVGRTPFTVPFTWYGGYDVVIRADGYKTVKTSAEVTAPWWQWIPFDLVTDFLPVEDQEYLHFDLKPDVPADPMTILARGEDMKGRLESSPLTVRKNVIDIKATSKPTTEPARDESQ